MKKLFFAANLLIISLLANAQNDEWHVVASDIDPANYYGVTVANGTLGLVSSPEPMKILVSVSNAMV